VIEKAHRFNPKKASFKTWLFTIARHRCIDLLRRQQKVKFLSIENNIGKEDEKNEVHLKDVLTENNLHISESQAKALVVEAVNDCLEELQIVNEKQAMVLYYITGKVYREIGEIFGKSISMVKKHITSAQEKVRRCLERKGIEQI
jgi:RNA polymerase sigma factor (sigma-70 family)